MGDIIDKLETQSESSSRPSFYQWDTFQSELLRFPGITMIWGDLGTGKTSLALQLTRVILDQNKKVFYLYSKSSHVDLILQRFIPHWNDIQQSQLFFWQATSFNKQGDIISQWLLQIQQLQQYFSSNRVGLLIIDEIASLYLLDRGKEKQNEKQNQLLIFQLATLTQIASQYKIPVLILNSATLKKNEHENSQTVPHGGKIIDFWTQLEIRIDRTRQISKMRLSLTKNKFKANLPQSWNWQLTDQGFA